MSLRREWSPDCLAVWAKRFERGTFRLPAARVEMTTAELAALLAGIDLDTARRRVRYRRPDTPPSTFGGECANNLQADADSAHDGLYTSGEIIQVGCLMHARRKFDEARTSDPLRSHQALAWIGLLYHVERELRGRETADYQAFVASRHRVRAERSRPIFDKIHDWLKAERPKVRPGSPIGEAIQSALNHWEALRSWAARKDSSRGATRGARRRRL